MAVIPQLVARDDASRTSLSLSPTTMKLLIALVVLFAVGFLCVGILLLIRTYRKKTFAPKHSLQQRGASRISHRRQGAATTPLDIRISEKEMLVEKEPSTPGSPVPEIRITFPDEDEMGQKRKSQVMVVTVSEKGSVGLEPYHEEQLPPYQPSDGRMQSLDLERLGGLKEKDTAGKQ